MQKKSFSKITVFLLALMFCVAVSGGCGGGSSGHYSGDYSDSSQNATTESVSQDVPPISAPEPEPISNSVSGDEYGDENNDDYGVNDDEKTVNFTDFSMLNNTDWDIESVRVVDSQGSEMSIYPDSFKVGSNNIKINKLTFSIAGDVMRWFNGSDTALVSEDLTINFRDMSSRLDNVQFKTQAAPILRTSAGFNEIASSVNSNTRDYQANIRVSRNGKSVLIGIETIKVAKNFPTYVTIQNQFVIGNNRFTSYLTLRASKSNNLFKSLNNTNWQIKSVNFTGGQGKAYSVINGSYNYDVSKITILTSVDNNVRTLNFIDAQGRAMTTPLTATCYDTDHSTPDFVATMLRSASGLKSNGVSNGYEVFQANLGQRQQNQYPDTEILYISNYGPDYDIVLNNSFYVQDANDPSKSYFYWVTLVLEPYKPDRALNMLNNSEWRITNIYIMNVTRNSTQSDSIIPNSYNYNADKLTLQILGGEALLWLDGDGNSHGNWNTPLTINFNNLYNYTFAAPILRSSSGFKFTEINDGYINYKVSVDSASETIQVDQDEPLSFLMIDNDFSAGEGYNKADYKIRIELEPYNSK